MSDVVSFETQDQKKYTAAILVIGDEILSGRTQDSNSHWIAGQLVRHGISLVEARTVPDHKALIIKALNELRDTVDYVFTTGGIGPTHDDITAQSVAEAFGVPLEKDSVAYKILQDYYGEQELTAAREKMAMIPQNALLIENSVSGAPGFRIGNVYVFAGVPQIMQAMFETIVHTLEGGLPILTSAISCSLPESVLAGDIGALQSALPEVQIGSYPSYRNGNLGVSLVVRATDQGVLESTTQKLIEIVRNLGDEPSIPVYQGAAYR